MYKYQSKIPLFSNKEIVIYTLLSILAVGAITYGYLQYSTNKQRLTDIGYAESLSNQLSGELGNAVGVMSSVTSVQQVLDDPYGDQLDTFALRAVDSSTLINTLSRYERVEAENLVEFSQHMSESGVYNFSISTLTTNGERVPVRAKQAYYPLVWLHPFSPVSATMIGIDLSTNASIHRTIQGSESTNTVQIAALPTGWSADTGNDLLLIKPTYVGRYAPDVNSKLASNSNGGVIMGIALSDYINDSNLIDPGYDISVWIKLFDETQATLREDVYVRPGEEDGQVYFKGFFTGVYATSAPLPGNSSLQITISGHGGISRNILTQAALLTIATCFILLVLFRLLFIIRQRDVAHRRDMESAQITLKAIGDAVITTNKNNIITYVNPSTEALLGQPSNQLLGKTINDTVSLINENRENLTSETEHSLAQAMASDTVINLPALQLAVTSDSPVFVSCKISPLYTDCLAQDKGHVLVLRDISAEQEMTRELAFMATHDSLTEIANRYHFENELKRLIASPVSQNRHHSICYIDLDQFKTINDTCGHSAGDRLLVRVSQGLNAIIRDNDLLARLGGDEFGLLIADCKEDDAIKIAKRIYAFFQTLYFKHVDDVFAVRASIGFVHISEQFDNIEDVMAAADLACYSAKDRGRNELYVFNHFHDETADRMSEMMWLPKLQMALRNDSFRLFIQPIVAIQSGNDAPCAPFEHYEILLRFVTDDGSLITPAQLIVAAERYNLMRDIDRWVVSNAISLIAKLKSQMGDSLPQFSINISGQSSVDSDFPGFINDQIVSSGIDPATLVFEITETSAITNMQSAVNLVDYLHDIGCKLALDDFGAGVSSFGYLKSLPVDYLKIDGQFIKYIDTNEVDREMVKCMRAVAKILGIEVVAEFVETKEIVEVLQELDVDYAQGYYYSKPHPMEDLLAYSEKNKAA